MLVVFTQLFNGHGSTQIEGSLTLSKASAKGVKEKMFFFFDSWLGGMPHFHLNKFRFILASTQNFIITMDVLSTNFLRHWKC